VGIHDEDVARVREATDIVAVISEYVQLKRVGRRWQGLCPFHAEKTPSFSVNAEMGVYHCFGCKASGDAITFLREVEHLDFPEAVERLAGRSGIALRYTAPGEGAVTGFVYFANPDNPNWLGPAPLPDIARQVRRSHGPSGANTEYVLQLAADFQQHRGGVDEQRRPAGVCGVRDQHFARYKRLVEGGVQHFRGAADDTWRHRDAP